MLKKRRKKKKQDQKVIKNIHMKFTVKKIGSFFFFFCKVIGYKSEN